MKAQLLAVGGALLWTVALLTGGMAQDQNNSSEFWGARGITLQMNGSGAEVEFDCGRGSITQPIAPNAAGEFNVRGTYTPEMGGPVRRDNPARELSATYKGKISGDSMHLEIVLDDNSRQLPEFTLTRGTHGKLVKCR